MAVDRADCVAGRRGLLLISHESTRHVDVSGHVGPHARWVVSEP